MPEHQHPLIDQFGRRHTSLRLSVTDRCNIRCTYCMPAEIVQFLPRPEILSFEELTRLARVFARLGVNKIRLTGGEPLVRKELPVLVSALREITAIEEIALTTNGMLLDGQAGSLKDAGLDRINVSLDTLDRAQFREITRRDGLPAALRGIAAARAAGFQDIRINAVAVQGLIESQIVPLAEFAREHQLTLRFIEFMPLNASGAWHDDDVLTGARIRKHLEQAIGPLIPVGRDEPSRPATEYRWASGNGRIGFINSVSEPFCDACNRLRLTADGKMRNCLFSHDEWDLRGPIREGASDESLQSIMLDCVAHKNRAHGIGSDGFEKPQRAMYQIGG